MERGSLSHNNMNTTEITESQVKEWMLARLAESMAITPRNATSFELKANNFNPGLGPQVMIRIYNSDTGICKECDNASEAMEYFRVLADDFSPIKRAKDIRKKAEALLAEADELEAQAASL